MNKKEKKRQERERREREERERSKNLGNAIPQKQSASDKEQLELIRKIIPSNIIEALKNEFKLDVNTNNANILQEIVKNYTESLNSKLKIEVDRAVGAEKESIRTDKELAAQDKELAEKLNLEAKQIEEIYGDWKKTFDKAGEKLRNETKGVLDQFISVSETFKNSMAEMNKANANIIGSATGSTVDITKAINKSSVEFAQAVKQLSENISSSSKDMVKSAVEINTDLSMQFGKISAELGQFRGECQKLNEDLEKKQEELMKLRKENSEFRFKQENPSIHINNVKQLELSIMEKNETLERLKKDCIEKQNELEDIENKYAEVEKEYKNLVDLDIVIAKKNAERAEAEVWHQEIKKQYDEMSGMLKEISKKDKADDPLFGIDVDKLGGPKAEELDKPSLNGLKQHIVDYAKNQGKIFYKSSTVSAFIASIAATKDEKIIILEGASGTGKTTLPRIAAEALDWACEKIDVSSNWTTREDLFGVYNPFSKRFIYTPFISTLCESTIYSNRPWLILLDEANIATIEYYLAEILAMKDNKVRITNQKIGSKIYPDEEIKIENNVRFILTANYDQSTKEISDKVLDRAQVITFPTPEIGKVSDNKAISRYISMQSLNMLFKNCLDKYARTPSQQKMSEHVDSILKVFRENKVISVGARIKKQMEEFIPIFEGCGERYETAIDLQVKEKVIRKLLNIIVKNKQVLEKVIDEIEILGTKLPETRKYLFEELIPNDKISFKEITE